LFRKLGYYSCSARMSLEKVFIVKEFDYELSLLSKRRSLLFSRRELVWIKRKAIRGRVWFRVLGRVERAIVDLVIRCVERVRSVKLEEVIMEIVERLENAFADDFDVLIERFGRPLAKKLSQIASKWGNVSAFAWVRERTFLMYLTVMHLNMPAVFRVGWVEGKF